MSSIDEIAYFNKFSKKRSETITMALTFKPISKHDVEYIRLLRNRNRQHFLDNKIIGPTNHLKWYKRYRMNPLDVMFIVKDYDTNDRLGVCAIYDLDMINQTCKIGRFIVEEDMRGWGIGSAMVRFCTNFALKVFKVRKAILLEVKGRNEKAIRLYKDNHFEIVSHHKGIAYMERKVEPDNV